VGCCWAKSADDKAIRKAAVKAWVRMAFYRIHREEGCGSSRDQYRYYPKLPAARLEEYRSILRDAELTPLSAHGAMRFHPTFYTSVGMEDADATTFQKSASFRQSAQLPCAAPADRSLNFCIPLNGETTTSPLRVAAVGRSSLGVSWLQVWVDGVKYFTEHDAGTPTQKLMNNYIYLPNGKHAVTMIAKEADGTSIKKTANILVVSPPTP